MIEECAHADEVPRALAVNRGPTATQTPLQAAHRQRRGDLVGALVEAGADVGGIFGSYRKLTPLAVCIAYGQVESVRALLRNGHDAMEKIEEQSYGSGDAFSTTHRPRLPRAAAAARPPLGPCRHLFNDRSAAARLPRGPASGGRRGRRCTRRMGRDVDHLAGAIRLARAMQLSLRRRGGESRARPACLGGRAHLGRFQQPWLYAADDGGLPQQHPLRALPDRGGGRARGRAQPKRRLHRITPVRGRRNGGAAAGRGRGRRHWSRRRADSALCIC